MEAHRWKTKSLIAVLFAVALAFPLSQASAHSHEHHDFASSPVARTPDAVDFRNEMRAAWEDHVVWTRNVILSVAHSLPDLNVVVERLLKNQDDIGTLFRPFYGHQSAARLTGLLREHIHVASEILTAAKVGNEVGVADAVARWQVNADEISFFLSRLNRHWPFNEMKTMMREHLDLTLAEAVARLEGRYVDDVAAYDQVHVAILDMADMLSLGVIAQQPRRFLN